MGEVTAMQMMRRMVGEKNGVEDGIEEREEARVGCCWSEVGVVAGDGVGWSVLV